MKNTIVTTSGGPAYPQDDIILGAGKDLKGTAGSGEVDLSMMTGTTKTSTGDNTLGGHTTIAAGKNLLGAAGAGKVDFKDMTGTFDSPAGAGTLNGNTTVKTGKTFDTTDVDALKSGGKIVPVYKILNVPLDALSVDKWIFVADAAYELVSLETAFTVAASGACNLDLKKSSTVQAPASGTSMLTGVVALQATANTVYAGTKHGTQSTRRLADGDMLGVTLSDAATGLVGCIVTIVLMRV